MKLTTAPTVLVLALTLVQCGDDDTDAEDSVENLIDCERVCTRYWECVDPINVSECAARCEDLADTDETFERQTSACEDCLQDKTCAEAGSCFDLCPVFPALLSGA